MRRNPEHQTNAPRPSSSGRGCTRSGCSEIAVVTLTYVYADSTAILAPLSSYVEPHSYDLCELHAEKLTVPKGWSFKENYLGIQPNITSPDDVMAIADAIRQTARMSLPQKTSTPEVGRRGHLRAIPIQE